MKTPIIPIPRASESTIQALVNAGILEVTEDGIKVTDNRSNKIEYYYSAQELEQADTTNRTAVRFKGLGEMSPEQLWDTTMNPQNRRLKKLTVSDAEKLSASISVCMGDNVAPRKEFIISNARFE